MNLDYINKYSWYRQGCDVCLFFIIAPFRAAIGTFGREETVVVQKGVHHKGYWAIESFIPKGEKIFLEQKKDKEFINNYIEKWNHIKQKVESLYNSINNDFLSLKENEFIKYVKKFFELDYEIWRNSLYPEHFDVLDYMLLEKEVKDIKFEKDDFNNLLSMDKKSPFMEIELLRDKKEFEDYIYLENDWRHVEILDKNYFDKKRKEITDERIEFINNFESNRKKEIAHLENKYNLKDEIKNLFYFFRMLAYFRDLRKVYLMKANHYYYQILKRVEKDRKIPYEELSFLIHNEVLELYNGNMSILDDVPNRKKWNAIVMKKDITIISGDEAKEISIAIENRFQKQFEQIKGRTGSPGKVKGKVKIILGKKDFYKFEEGCILIAPMTRPEYVPLMQKASAIVTDEGGITCHAAVIARELNIPCVIGTQVATELLKDGDKVEVDANKGIVKKISK